VPGLDVGIVRPFRIGNVLHEARAHDARRLVEAGRLEGGADRGGAEMQIGVPVANLIRLVVDGESGNAVV
jgi:ribosomal protein S6E (S10)